MNYSTPRWNEKAHNWKTEWKSVIWMSWFPMSLDGLMIQKGLIATCTLDINTWIGQMVLVCWAKVGSLAEFVTLSKKTLKRHTVLEQTAIECPPSRSLIAIAIDCNCFLSLREHKKTPWRQIFIYNIFWMHTCKSYSNMHWCIIYSADTRKKYIHMYTE